METLYRSAIQHDVKPSEIDIQLEEESAVESDALGSDLLESEIIDRKLQAR